MAWVETSSAFFRARHDSAHGDDAEWVLDSLEHTRAQLEELLPRTPGELTVVLHPGTLSLTMANPLLPLRWLLTAPAARRYIAGWAGRRELHVLTPVVLAERASNVPGSREMLELAPAALYARRVVTENNQELVHARAAGRAAAELRWAWLLEGGARWLCGQSDYARPAIARRLREGSRPSFPPGIRDAALLGGTVFDLLAREEGERAAVNFATRLHPQGARAALTRAFGGRSLVHSEGAWRSHLARLASVA
ncbi:MAG TPA: hypothetical protein VLP43_08465 [Solirubrobacteraceae bacterium]|nr:hypothetical protein [Solirubrobacteraceae bacterium]